MNEGNILILSAPSGCGKDTIASLLADSDDYRISVSVTTRKMRPGDIEGETYRFISKEQFLKMQENDLLFESACYNGNYYGTPKEPIIEWLHDGKTVILVIEVQGAEKMRKLFPEAVSVFVLPPSMKELRCRLENRNTETSEEVENRIDTARDEIKRAVEFHYVVVNDKLEEAVESIKCIVSAQKYKTEKMIESINEVLNNG